MLLHHVFVRGEKRAFALSEIFVRHLNVIVVDRLTMRLENDRPWRRFEMKSNGLSRSFDREYRSSRVERRFRRPENVFLRTIELSTFDRRRAAE